ncbi:prp40 pre-mRNA processing factor 40 [Anaeramoeba flamelloides]|uniref:Prp40 pre-mRNA processing factor 40 n=1 Tax=Anaeramoeba flamelloides TaxID=1746091 RepID=A0ABQ8XB44_9EUKA|nr:prp40 pre-mRNA processing factor 40 [Anaeramoeba flamelloides]
MNTNDFVVTQRDNLVQLSRFLSKIVKPLQSKIRTELIVSRQQFNLIFKSLLEMHSVIKKTINGYEGISQNEWKEELEFWNENISSKGSFVILLRYIEKLPAIIIEFSQIMKHVNFRLWLATQFKNIRRTYTTIELFDSFLSPLHCFTDFVKVFQTTTEEIHKRNEDQTEQVSNIQNSINEIFSKNEFILNQISELEKLYQLDQQIKGEVIINLVSPNRKVELELKVKKVKNLSTNMESNNDHNLFILTDLFLITKFEQKTKSFQYLYVIPLGSISIEKITEHHMQIMANQFSLKIQFSSTQDVKRTAEIIKSVSSLASLNIGETTGLPRIHELEKRILDLQDILTYLQTQVKELQETPQYLEYDEQLPKGWVKAQNNEGQIYYYNAKMQQSVWKLQDLLRSDWKRVRGIDDRIYYTNTKTGDITWTFPLKDKYLEGKKKKRKKKKVYVENDQNEN